MQVFLLIFIIVQIAFVVVFRAVASAKVDLNYGDVKLKKSIRFLLPGTLLIVENKRFSQYFSNLINHIHLKLYKLNSKEHTRKKTLIFVAELIISSQLLLLFFSLIAWLNNDPAALLTGIVFITILMFYRYIRLDKELLKRKRECISELPLFLHSLVLLINAGESMQSAFVKVCKASLQLPDSFLKAQLIMTMHELENGTSFVNAMEGLNQRVAVHEISIFTTTLILNARRGGRDLALILENLAYDFWHRRINEARTIGEEASSKFVFPMLLIFIVVIMVLATPAILIF